MSPLFKKLNLKAGNALLVLNAPTDFDSALSQLPDHEIQTEAQEGGKHDFVLVFVSNQVELRDIAATAFADSGGDVIVWCAYPKKSSKRYSSDINRDSDWSLLGALGFEAVRQVAIDEDWSALRFRRVDYIGPMTRAPKRALTPEGKCKTSGK
jgi:hypothetical protein